MNLGVHRVLEFRMSAFGLNIGVHRFIFGV